MQRLSEQLDCQAKTQSQTQGLEVFDFKAPALRVGWAVFQGGFQEYEIPDGQGKTRAAEHPPGGQAAQQTCHCQADRGQQANEWQA